MFKLQIFKKFCILKIADFQKIVNFRKKLTTIHPILRKTMTPKILTITDVKTPSHVPKSTGSFRKKFALHQGLSAESEEYFKKLSRDTI